ncbi:MAG: hypothetical protein WDZ48_10755 [Pirellulales bacterium]
MTFDDRLWPVIGALVLLGGIGAAIILAIANFDDPRTWANGWTYLGSLAAVTVILILGVSRLDPSRRGLQLAAVLSLILHILLFASLNQNRVFALAELRSSKLPLPETIEPYKAPDYHIRAPEDPIEEHEKPLATTLPEERAAEPERAETQRLQEQAPSGQPAPVPGQQPEVEPHAVPLRQPEDAAPRMAEVSAELSRAEPRPVEVAEPQPVATPAQEIASEAELPAPADASLARRQLETDMRLAASTEPPPPQSQPAQVDVNSLERQSMPERTPATRPSLAQPLSGRDQKAPQLRAPQIADAPRARSGVDQPLDEPQPLVKVPLRAGAGSRLPVEFGTIREDAAKGVSIGPVQDVPRTLPAADSAESLGKVLPGQSSQIMKKSTATAAARPSLGTAGSTESLATTAASPAGLPGVAPAATTARSQTAASLPVRVAAPQGNGGVATQITPQVGTPSRRARKDSQVVPATSRLLARASAGPLAIDGRTREPAEAFARRGGRREDRGTSAGEPSDQTEAAIELGLAFLARHQAADGSWNLHFALPGQSNLDEPPVFRAQTAATGLALLSFLGAGYDHYGGQYADVVQRALDYLVKHQQPNGDLYKSEDAESNKSARFYSHGIAAIALCEAYGMTGDRALAGGAQKAIDFIIAGQDPTRGAWRYVPGNGSDTSVSGWQLMALKSGELAGLEVSRAAYEKVERWLDRAQVSGSQYVYNPIAPETSQQRHGRQPTPAMTAVGLLMRLYTGLNRDDAHMIEGAQYLLSQLPDNGRADAPARDTYYWYYATQVMFHMRGKYWQAWNDRLRPLLLGEQVPNGSLAGSWDPQRPVPDRWGPQGGRIYVTTLNLLSLEVYYRHLPLYDSTAK